MFIDDVMKQYPDIPKPDAVFKIQNVADYYYKVEPEGMIDYEKDVISYAIPFTKAWFEFKTPSYMRIGNKTEICPLNLEVGIYAVDVEKMIRTDSNASQFNCIDMNVFATIPHVRDYHLGNRKFLLDNKYNYIGRRISNNKDLHIIPSTLNLKLSETFKLRGISESVLSEWIFGFLNPVLMTLNFLHCKNVEQVSNILSKELKKSRQKRNKPYFEKYYTLAIEPMKKTLDTEGHAQIKGLSHALHICRGHFKTYENKGLFGKLKGTFWWPSTIRGNEEIGKINKDYEIKLKEELTCKT